MFVIRSNNRRDLKSDQRAAVAVEAVELMAEITRETERERREKQAESLRRIHEENKFGVSPKKLGKTNHENKTAHKLAEAFNRQWNGCLRSPKP